MEVTKYSNVQILQRDTHSLVGEVRCKASCSANGRVRRKALAERPHIWAREPYSCSKLVRLVPGREYSLQQFQKTQQDWKERRT